MKTAILLAAYNGKPYLMEQLDSLFSQTVGDFVVYVHDDGSTDDTMSVINDFSKKYPERLVVVEGEPQGGAKYNFWFLMKEIEADIYFFCDQDDVWLPQKVEKERQALSKATGPAVVFSDMKVVDGEMNEIAPSFIRYTGCNAQLHAYPQLIIDNIAAGATIAFNRALRDALIAAKIDPGAVEMHDGIVMAAGDLIGEVIYMEEPLVYYRQHADNEIGAIHEGILTKIGRNVAGIVCGRWLEQKKAFISLSKNAARELLKLDGLKEKDKKILRIYLNTDSLSKVQRIRFLRRNGFRRAHHTWWMYLWI